jgi:hypothetical protein
LMLGTQSVTVASCRQSPRGAVGHRDEEQSVTTRCSQPPRGGISHRDEVQSVFVTRCSQSPRGAVNHLDEMQPVSDYEVAVTPSHERRSLWSTASTRSQSLGAFCLSSVHLSGSLAERRRRSLKATSSIGLHWAHAERRSLWLTAATRSRSLGALSTVTTTDGRTQLGRNSSATWSPSAVVREAIVGWEIDGVGVPVGCVDVVGVGGGR